LYVLDDQTKVFSISFIRWNPDAIVFNSFQLYGTPSYWMQLFFSESNGATLLNSSLQATGSNSLIASAITWQNSADKKTYIRIKVTKTTLH
jgi:alpha-N-arabinofuranosidase